MNRIELICQILREFGLNPEVEDSRVFFKFELKTFYVDVHEDTVDEIGEVHEDSYIRVGFPHFYLLEQDDIMDALVVCSEVNRSMRLIKTFLSDEMDTICSSVDFNYTSEDDLRNSLRQALQALSQIKSWFYWRMAQMKKDTEAE